MDRPISQSKGTIQLRSHLGKSLSAFTKGAKNKKRYVDLKGCADALLLAAKAERLAQGAGVTRMLHHKLDVHQVKVELQNEEMLRTRQTTDEALVKLTRLFDCSPVGQFTLSSGGVIHAANLPGAALLGLERSRLLGRSFPSFVAPKDQLTITSFIGEVLERRERKTLELVLVPIASSPFFAHIAAVASATGQECNIAVIDITRRKEEEENLKALRIHQEMQAREREKVLADEIAQRKWLSGELNELNDQIEHRVAEQTRELQSMVRDLQTFFYSVSHDLRTPLRSINSYANVLLEEYGGVLDLGVKGIISTIINRTVRMDNLIKDLLLFAKSSKEKVTRTQVDMTMLTEEVVGMLFSGKPSSRIEFRIAELPLAGGDRVLLTQVLENLLANAVKFSGSASKPVVEVGTVPDENENIYFVKDNGIGFDMKYARVIFGAFQRLSRSENYEGTGVGLAIVEQIITKHGGRVWAESKPGEGATFFFSLPKVPELDVRGADVGGSARSNAM